MRGTSSPTTTRQTPDRPARSAGSRGSPRERPGRDPERLSVLVLAPTAPFGSDLSERLSAVRDSLGVEHTRRPCLVRSPPDRVAVPHPPLDRARYARGARAAVRDRRRHLAARLERLDALPALAAAVFDHDEHGLSGPRCGGANRTRVAGLMRPDWEPAPSPHLVREQVLVGRQLVELCSDRCSPLA